MVRYIFLNAFLLIYSILFCLWGIAISIRDPKGRRVHAYCAVPWGKSVLWVCGVKVRVRGLENLEADVPRIYMVNHQSYFDIFTSAREPPCSVQVCLERGVDEDSVPGCCHAKSKVCRHRKG